MHYPGHGQSQVWASLLLPKPLPVRSRHRTKHWTASTVKSADSWRGSCPSAETRAETGSQVVPILEPCT